MNSKNYLFCVFDVDYLPAFIDSGLGINAVRHLCLTGIFVRVELWCCESVVSTARPCACM